MLKIRHVIDKDAVRLAEIYNYYIKHTTITFEEIPVSTAMMLERVKKVHESHLPWYIVELEDKIIGYIYATKWDHHSAYRFTVESSIYLAEEFIGKNIGKQLYIHLIRNLYSRSIRNIMVSIALPNPISVHLHQKLGFKKVGESHKVGFKFNRWISVGYWQLMLNQHVRSDPHVFRIEDLQSYESQ